MLPQFALTFGLALTAQVSTATTTWTPEGDAPAGDPPMPALVAPATDETETPAIEPAGEPEGVTPDAGAEPAPQPAPEDEPLTVEPDDYFQFSDLVDTRVTFAISNVNLFAGPGERTSQTSGYRIGVDPNLNLFLENVNTRFSGYESLSHLVLYKKMPAFWKYWETEAALAALVLADTQSGQFRFFDSGTYLRIIRKLGEGDERDTGSFDLTAWPVAADRYRLGYTFLISWGGTAVFPGKLQSSSITEGAVPGMRLRYTAPKGKAYAHIGFKSALLLNREPGVRAGEQVPNYGILGGGGIDLLDNFVLEANGGFFQKGTQERPGVEGRKINAYGGSAKLTFFTGKKPSGSADFRLYRNDPQNPANYNLFKGFRTGRAFSVSLEGNVLGQNLEDPDRFGSERLVTAVAAGLVGQARMDQLWFRVDAFYQSADFILFNVPGFVPFQATPSQSTTSAEIFAAGTIGYDFPDWHFQPKLAVGIRIPATYKGAVLPEQGNIGGANAGDLRTQLIVDETTRIVLPPNTNPTPIVGAFLHLPVALSKTLAVAGQVRVELDDNQPRIAQDNERGEVTYIFDDPLRIALTLYLQSRF